MTMLGQGRSAPLAGAPRSVYFDDDTTPFPDWNALVIAGGDMTLGVDLTGYTHKTIYFLSTLQGTVTVMVLAPDGVTWTELDYFGVSSGQVRAYPMEEQVTQVRLMFSEAATVSAWITVGVT